MRGFCARALRKDPAGKPEDSAAAHSPGFAAALLDGSGDRPPAGVTGGNDERVGLRKVRRRGEPLAVSDGAERGGHVSRCERRRRLF